MMTDEITNYNIDVRFLHMDIEQQRSMRLIKAIDGIIFIGLSLAPGMPIINKIALFLINNDFKPVFLCYIYQEHFDDDSYLRHRYDQYLKSLDNF